MRCEHCQGRQYVTRDVEYAVSREMVVYVEYTPCPECHGSGIVSCCEGSARHGQLGEPCINQETDDGKSKEEG